MGNVDVLKRESPPTAMGCVDLFDKVGGAVFRRSRIFLSVAVVSSFFSSRGGLLRVRSLASVGVFL